MQARTIIVAVVAAFLLTAGASSNAVPSMYSPANDLALNPTGSGYPSPLESDDGWGGGTSKWDLVDGQRMYPGESRKTGIRSR